MFGSDIVEFLGFELSECGIRPQRRLTSAIVDFPTPANRKELRSFLGVAGFYRHFVPNFATISEPLTRLTSENVNFVWDEGCVTAFQALKEVLTTSPVLAFPRLDREFILEVDASGIAVGGVLSQYSDCGELHPVAYFSTALTPAQQKWSVYDQEAYAMICAVRHWYVYLYGNKFILNSDHNPLSYLHKKKDIRGKTGRWVAEMEGLDFTVIYIPGKNNYKADALSRNRKADPEVPVDWMDKRIYTIYLDRDTFFDQLRHEQC